MINTYYKETDRRFLILVNKQNDHAVSCRPDEKTSIPERELTICCAGLKSNTSMGVTIATVQSFVGMVDSYPGADLVLDEVHGVTIDGECGKVLSKIENLTCILGCTATPYDLDTA